MNTRTNSLSLLGAGLVGVLIVSAVVMAQGKYRKDAHAGPYRVVLSKPVVGLSYTAGTLYREHEYLGAMFNQLDADGLVPIMTQVLTQTLDGHDDVQRLLVVCRKP